MADPLVQSMKGIQGFQGGTTLDRKGPVKAVGPAQIDYQRGDNGLAAAMKSFISAGAEAYGAYEKTQKDRAEDRSNEIIRKLSPEQRRAAIQDGTLLYKDDPYAMAMLRQKTGRNAAFEVDSEIQQKITAGQFRTREELDEYRQTRLQDRAKSYAEQAGINHEDVDYKRGFDADIVQRNAGIYDMQNRFLSKNLEAQASIEARNDLTPLLSDPKFLGGAGSGNIVTGYINNGLYSGEIPTDRQAIDAVRMVTTDAITKEGGAAFLRDFKDKKIKVLGGEQTIENLLGPDVYEDMLTKADTAAYERNAKKQETLSLGISQALAQQDPSAGWQMLNKLEQENDWVQQGEQMTQQRNQLIQAKARLIESVRQQSMNGRSALEKRAQSDNRQLVIDEAYTKRMNDQNISVDPKFLPTDDNTGEFKDSDMATYAHNKMNQIDQMDIPDEQKDEMKLAYLKGDYKGGPFRAAFETLTQDSAQEWQAAIIQGNSDGLKRFKELQRVYHANPSLMAQLYPEQAGMMEKMRLMGEHGLEPQVMIDAERNKPKDETEKRFREEQWTAIKNDSATADILKYIPGDMETMARAVFDANTTMTGDSSAASKAVTEFLQKNTVTFTNDAGWRSSDTFHGMLSKADLQVDPNNLQSWETGKQIIDETLKDLAKDSVWGMSGVSVSSRNGNIIIQNLTGARMTISPDQFRVIGAKRAEKMRKEAEEKAQAETQRTQKLYDKYMRGGAK